MPPSGGGSFQVLSAVDRQAFRFPIDTPQQRRLAADAGAVKIRVSRAGVFRLTQADLAATGFDVAADPRAFRMYHLGREIPILVRGEADGRFDGEDSVLFHGTRSPWRASNNAESPAYSNENVYWLAVREPSGLRMEEVWVRPESGVGTVADVDSVSHVEANRYLFPRLVADEGADLWFDTYMLAQAGVPRSTARVEVVVPTPALAPRVHTARLEVAMGGVTEWPPNPDHHLVVRVGGQVVGEMSWEGRAPAAVSFDVPSALLEDGETRVELELP